MKRVFLPLILCIAIIMVVLPQSFALAAVSETSDSDTAGICGDNLTWSLDDNGTLTISGTGEMEDYEWEGSPWYLSSSIKNVVVEEGVTSIGNYAFDFCLNLESVTISDTVTSIGERAFSFCEKLESITIPDSVTSIGKSVFYCCERLTEINVDSNNPNYSSKDGVLFNKGKTELVLCLEGKTGEYEVPDSVISIGESAFAYCDKLTSITIPDSVTNIGIQAFHQCRSLEKVTMCKGVTKIKNDAFSACVSLTSITIPDSVASIGDNAFVSCESLTEINVDSNNLYYSSEDGVLFDKDKTELIICPEGKVGAYEIPDSVANIGNCAFRWCKNLENITIPDSVMSIGEYAFRWCENLGYIIIPDSVTYIGDWAFAGCESLASVTISHSVTRIGNYAFYNCESLTSVTIPDSVISIGNYTFADCNNLVEINVDSNNPNYSSEDGVLFDKEKTELVQCPSGKVGEYEIPDGVTRIGYYAFYGCNKLTSITIPGSVTRIGDWAFHNYHSLTNIVIENGVTGIGYGAFYGCENLTSVTIPSSVTYIGEQAFYGCENLSDVVYSGTPEQWGWIDIGGGNENLINACEGPKTPLAYVLSAFQKYNVATGKYYAKFALIDENGMFSTKTIDDVLDFSGQPALEKGHIGLLSKPDGKYPAGSFVRYTMDAEGVITSIDNNGLLKSDISATLNYNESTVSDGLYLVNVVSERNGFLYFFETGVEVDPQNGEIKRLNFCKDWYGAVAIDCEEYVGDYIFKIPSRQTDKLKPGIGNAVIEVEEGEIVRIFSFSEGYEVEINEEDKRQVRVSVASENENEGTVTGNGEYIIGTSVTVTANAEVGYTFSGWYSEGERVSEDVEYTFTAESDISLVAKFTKKRTTTFGGGGGFVPVQDTQDGADNVDENPVEDTPDNVPAMSFTDIDSHAWAEDAINKLAQKGIIKGTSEITFSPGSNITRADFAILLVRAFNLESENTENFDDVKASDYFAHELAIARNTGIVGGIGDNKYAPNAAITRQDMMLMLVRALEVQGKLPETFDDGELARFADEEQISGYAYDSVKKLVKAGIITGANGKILPFACATRAEVAVMLARILV